MLEGRTDLRFTFAVEPTAAATIRAELRAVDSLADGMRPDLELLVTELVANVVRHSGLGAEETMEVDVRIRPAHVRVEVHDSGRGFRGPVPEPHRQVGEFSGYGLYLVDQIASRWGTIDGLGTTIWFELEERPDS